MISKVFLITEVQIYQNLNYKYLSVHCVHYYYYYCYYLVPRRFRFHETEALPWMGRGRKLN